MIVLQEACRSFAGDVTTLIINYLLLPTKHYYMYHAPCTRPPDSTHAVYPDVPPLKPPEVKKPRLEFDLEKYEQASKRARQAQGRPLGLVPTTCRRLRVIAAVPLQSAERNF